MVSVLLTLKNRIKGVTKKVTPPIIYIFNICKGIIAILTGRTKSTTKSYDFTYNHTHCYYIQRPKYDSAKIVITDRIPNRRNEIY